MPLSYNRSIPAEFNLQENPLSSKIVGCIRPKAVMHQPFTSRSRRRHDSQKRRVRGKGRRDLLEAVGVKEMEGSLESALAAIQDANISLFIAFGSTVVAALAAYFSYLSAKTTLLAYEAHLINEQAAKYASPEFLHHLRVLSRWRQRVTNGEQLDFIPLLTARNAEALDVDAARRAIKMHYESVARLARAGYLRKKAVREICRTAGLDLYFDVAIPLTKEIDPGLDLSISRYLNSLGLERHRVMSIV